MTTVAFKLATTDPRPDGSVFSPEALDRMILQVIGRPIDLHGKVVVVTRAYVEREDNRAALIVEAEN